MAFTGNFLGKVVSLDEVSGKPRVKFQLLKEGEWSHPSAPNGKLKINDALLAEFETNFRAGIRGTELPTNHDHDDPLFKRSPAWIVEMERKPGELNGVFEFTDPELYGAVKRGEVKYISPELQFGWKNPADDRTYNVMKGAAFTNVPFIKGMKSAQFLNLSEVLAEDAEFAAQFTEMIEEGGDTIEVDDPTFNECLKGIEKEVKDRGWDEWGSWEWRKKDLTRCYKKLLDASREQVLDRALAFENDVNAYFTSLINDHNEAKVVMGEWIYPLLQLSKNATNRTYLDGPTEATEPHRTPTALTLSDVDTTGQGNRAYTSQADEEDVETDNDRSNVDDKDKKNSGRLPSGSEDPDAENPDLPSQCESCQKLSEGSCPFQGIDVKTAAAGEGNCPQYVSSQTQLTPDRDGSEGLEQQGGSSVHFNERTPNMPDEPTITLAEFQALQAQVTTLSETVQGLASENETLKSDKTSLEERVVLSEQQLKTEATLRAQAQANAFVDKYVNTGKITPAQGNVVLSILAVDRGEEVHLNESPEPATLTALLTELLESNEVQVPVTTEGPNATARLSGGAPDTNVGLSEHEKLLPKMEAKAKEIALAEGGDWRKYMSKAAREVTREVALAENGGTN